jgi:hypothetical protein
MSYHEGVDGFGLELLVGVANGLTARRIQLHRTLGQGRVRTTACRKKEGGREGSGRGRRKREGREGREGWGRREGLPEAVLMAASASMSPTGGGTQEQSQASDRGRTCLLLWPFGVCYKGLCVFVCSGTLCVVVVVVFELLSPPDHEATLQTALVLVLFPSHHTTCHQSRQSITPFHTPLPCSPFLLPYRVIVCPYAVPGRRRPLRSVWRCLPPRPAPVLCLGPCRRPRRYSSPAPGPPRQLRERKRHNTHRLHTTSAHHHPT